MVRWSMVDLLPVNPYRTVAVLAPYRGASLNLGHAANCPSWHLDAFLHELP
jgi:hypothetical protein